MDQIDVDGTPFSVIMDRAVKLKSKQLSEERVEYDSYPSFFRNSIFPSDAVTKARDLCSFDDRLEAAKRLKEEGNVSFREGHMLDALSKYEQALSVFRFLENSNPAWKTEGIKDRFIKEVRYKCIDIRETNDLNMFLVACYNNIAIVSHKLKDYEISIEACGWALEIDGKCDKSFFLRAQSRLAPLSAGIEEEEAAVCDLETALCINPNNKEARKLLRNTKSKAKLQRSRDKQTFHGLFTRGEIYDSRELLDAKEASRNKTKLEDEAKRNRDLVLGQQLMKFYDERGMESEKEKIAVCLTDEINHRGRRPGAKDFDFRNPTNEMIQDAKSMGVDLFDPQTIVILEELQKNGRLQDERNESLALEKKGTSLVNEKHDRHQGILRGLLPFLVSLVVLILYTNHYLKTLH